ncbi:MAG TPA: hypothetical protein V6D22_11430 [Candidatus Obscuribacterales bacterium]
MTRIKRLAAAALLAMSFTGQIARADDGGISFGGSPHLMGAHASVAMKDEVVTMDISDKLIKVDCKFLFHNDGPAAVVRMGFPDQGQGAAEPYEGVDIRPTGSNLKATFRTYDSWVDGKKVATKLVPTNNRELYWHTKTVSFKPKSDCLIRDTYTLEPGAQVTAENGMYQQTYYVLHTGSSWHGPIGKAEIIVKFAPDVVHGPINLRALSSIPGKDVKHLKWSTMPANTVIYEGPVEPKVEGNTLRFVCENLKPTEKDDVHLYYAFRMLHNL